MAPPTTERVCTCHVTWVLVVWSPCGPWVGCSEGTQSSTLVPRTSYVVWLAIRSKRRPGNQGTYVPGLCPRDKSEHEHEHEHENALSSAPICHGNAGTMRQTRSRCWTAHDGSRMCGGSAPRVRSRVRRPRGEQRAPCCSLRGLLNRAPESSVRSSMARFSTIQHGTIQHDSPC